MLLAANFSDTVTMRDYTDMKPGAETASRTTCHYYRSYIRGYPLAVENFEMRGL